MRLVIVILTSFAWITYAEAVTMNEAVRYCYSDSRKLCRDLGHGSKMQNCLNSRFQQLSPGCQKIVIRLNQGETITLF